jgi:hypothetical protein
MTSSGHAAAALDTHQKWIPSLEMATCEVFELMLSFKLAPASRMDESSLNVTSMVGLAEWLCGVITVRCDEKTAILMASKMLGLPVVLLWSKVPEVQGGWPFSPNVRTFPRPRIRQAELRCAAVALETWGAADFCNCVSDSRNSG